MKKAVYKTITLALAAVMTLSVIMLGTIAMGGIKTATGEGSNDDPQNYSVTLTKYEKAGGDTIEGAEFYLYKKGDGDAVTQINGRYTTDTDGKIEVDQLEEGDYYFLETNPTYGHDYDNGKTEYHFTVDENTTHAAVTAFNPRILRDLTITKTVVDLLAEGDPNQLFDFTITLSESGEFTYEIDGVEQSGKVSDGDTIQLKHGQTAVIKDLPVGTTYTVKETPVANYSIESNGHRGNITLSGATAEFTNTYGIIPPGEAKLIVKKIVAGEAADLDKEFDFVVTIDGVEHKISLKHGESEEFTFPLGTLYEVYEEDYFEDGYNQTSITKGYGTATAPITEVVVTNTYFEDVYITIDGEKTWDMNGHNDVAKPANIEVYLMNGNLVVGIETVLADENWQYSFEVPKFDKDGSEITYTIKEKDVEGYLSTVSGFNIKNTYIAPASYKPAVKKTIKGDTPQGSEDFVFKLTALGGAPMPSGNTVTINGAGTADFDTITCNTAGVYQYTIEEIPDTKEGYTYDTTKYTLTVTVEQKNNKLEIKSATYDNGSKTLSQAEFTNTFSKNPLTTSVKATKIWDDNNSSERPQSVQVQLYKDGAAHGSSVVLSNANGWLHVWSGLDKNAVWSVDEPNVPTGYIRQLGGNATDGFVITNLLGKADQKITISGLKTWIHDGNDGKYPDHITIYVKKGDKNVVEKRVTEKDDWSWTFTLPKYDADGNEINYTISEADVAGYAKNISGYDITNTFVQKGGDKVPDTSDNSGIVLWLTILTISGLSLVCLTVFHKKLSKFS
jgi:streptococcal pilin isopeptide linkage domain